MESRMWSGNMVCFSEEALAEVPQKVDGDSGDRLSGFGRELPSGAKGVFFHGDNFPLNLTSTM